ncbi:MAG: Prenyltransferase, partial [Actinomycetia bacterium]|nr:Prenyltransferase [Actinomycetes bacterium]
MFRRPLIRRALAGGIAVLAMGALTLGGVTAAGAVSAANATAAQNAVFFVNIQQQSDGTIGTSVSETQDAALAIAGNAQTTSEWNPAEGRDAVAAVKNNGHSPIDALVANAQSVGFLPSEAARTIVLVAAPLGFDPVNFGGVNLVAKVRSGANGDGSYGGMFQFDDTVYSALALRLATGSVPADTLTYIRGAQQSDGGWNISGINNGAVSDAEHTGKALMALIAGGAVADDPAVRAGV